jgi:hypothetical protein
MKSFNAPTHAPYGEQMVPVESGYAVEPDQNDMCPYCDRKLDWYPQDDNFGVWSMSFDPPVFTDVQGTKCCNERCELLSRLDHLGQCLRLGCVSGRVGLGIWACPNENGAKQSRTKIGRNNCRNALWFR